MAPKGPRKIAPKNQVSVPRELLDAIGVQVGEAVYVGLNPDKAGTLVVIPQKLMDDIFQKGWTAL